jgi:hypothetical protein
MSDKNTKVCKDCVHYSKSWWFAEPDCTHEQSLFLVCLIEGKTKWMTCRKMRWDHNPCGSDAMLFEPKGDKK